MQTTCLIVSLPQFLEALIPDGWGHLHPGCIFSLKCTYL